jgi:hypothetical protein
VIVRLSLLLSHLLDRDVEIVVTAGITHEDGHTFKHIFDLVLFLFRELEDSIFVLLLDGDRATWQAAKTCFPNCVIILCLYHASVNMKKRMGPACRSFAIQSKAEALDKETSMATVSSTADVPSSDVFASSLTFVSPPVTAKSTVTSAPLQSTNSNEVVNMSTVVEEPSVLRWIQCKECDKFRKLPEDQLFGDSFCCANAYYGDSSYTKSKNSPIVYVTVNNVITMIIVEIGTACNSKPNTDSYRYE